MRRFRALTLSIAALGGLVALPTVAVAADPAAADTPAASTSYTPATPSLATITNGTAAAAPWNEYQGDSSVGGVVAPASVLPTYTPGTGTSASTVPDISDFPASSSSATPYPSGVVGSPGPLAGYCGAGNNAAASAGEPARQPAGSTLPLAPAYFPHIVRNADGSLTGYFDYRPKDADEAIVVGQSTDGGKDWTYQGEALEQDSGYCPNADINDDGQGHPNVVSTGGTSYLYTLPRAAGDNAGVGMLVHNLTAAGATESNPLGDLPATEQTGVDPDDFSSGGVTVPATGGAGATIDLADPVGSGPEQLVAGEFVDLTQTPIPDAADVITCTTVATQALEGCTTDGSSQIDVTNGDLIEQVIGTIAATGQKKGCTASGKNYVAPCTIPTGPNTPSGGGGVAKVVLNPTNPDDTSLALYNAGAPGRLYVDGIAVYCNQANAYPTNEIEACTTGEGGQTFAANAGDPVTADPIVPATAQQTTGLIAPDGIVSALPQSADVEDGAPAGSTVVLYTEKILNYYITGYTTNGSDDTFASITTSGVNFFPGSSYPADLGSADAAAVNAEGSAQATITLPDAVTVTLGDDTLAKTSAVYVPVTCTEIETNAGVNSGWPGQQTATLTGCSVPSSIAGSSYSSSDGYASNSFIAAPGAALVAPSSLALTGEGSATNAQKLFKNNEDLTELRLAYTTDGVNFTDLGAISGNGTESDGTAGTDTYNDINNPASTVDPPNGLNQYNTAGEALGTEMRWVGSAGSVITNPNGTLGLFLSGAWAGDGDSDSFNQVFYAESSDGGLQWTTPVDVISTDYTFSASVAQEQALANGQDEPLGISAYYSGRAYAPSVVQNSDGSLTMLFAGDRLPKSISSAGTVVGTGSSQYTVEADDPSLYRSILDVTLTTATTPAVTTTASVTASTTTPVVGQPVTYTATVAPVAPGTGDPTGTVTFTNASNETLCSGVALSQSSPDTAKCTTTYGAVGSDAVTVSYSGDSNYAQTTSTTPASVTIGPDQTTTSLAVSPGAPVVGQEVTFTATVAPVSPGGGLPTGTVTFVSQTGTVKTTLCVSSLGAVTPGQATCQGAYATTGSRTVTAVYAGTANYTGSTSNGVTLAVGAAQTTVSVSGSPDTLVTGQAVTFTAKVSVVAPGTGTPTGLVLFVLSGKSGFLLPCSGGNLALLSGGSATCTVPAAFLAASVGPLTVTVGYAGSPAYLPSIGKASQSIEADATTTTVTSSSSKPLAPGAAVTFSSSVHAAAPGSGLPTGTVTFSFSSAKVACVGGDTVPVGFSGTAVCAVARGEVTSAVTVTASYGGSVNYTASSASLTQPVR